ncbi:hypothetical protein [Nostoc sp. PCC 7524]
MTKIMIVAKPLCLKLDEFLQLPQTKPASEYIDGDISYQVG